MNPSGKNDYETPQKIKKRFEGFFDPCPKDADFNGLQVPWHLNNYVNPPFDEKEKWILKAIAEMRKGHYTVMLLPVDTSTSWFHDLILQYSTIEFIRGRIYFNGKRPNFSCMLCHFGAIGQ